MVESTGGSAEDRIAAALRDHVFRIGGHVGDGTVVPNSCWGNGCRWEGSYSEHRAHVAGEIAKALQLTEERRTLTDGWIQPMRNAMYFAQGLTPPPAVITNEARLVSPWTEVVDA